MFHYKKLFSNSLQFSGVNKEECEQKGGKWIQYRGRGLCVFEKGDFRILNLTPHDLNIYDPEGEKQLLSIPRSGLTVRAKEQTLPATPLTITVERLEERKTPFGGKPYIRRVKAPLVSIPVVKKTYGKPYIQEAPDIDIEELVIKGAKANAVITSILTLKPMKEAMLTHPDVRVLAPDTGPESAVRDSTGRIIGVKRLQE